MWIEQMANQKAQIGLQAYYAEQQKKIAEDMLKLQTDQGI